MWATPYSSSPDCVFADRADPASIEDLNGYIISVMGKPPDFVLEVASRSTGRRDYTVKREGYATLGIREYWRFDYTGGRFHDAPLAGDKLVDGVYVPIDIAHEPDGRHWGYSEALGLELWWDGGMLRFRDPATGEFLPGPAEFDEALRSEREGAEVRARGPRVRAPGPRVRGAPSRVRGAPSRRSRSSPRTSRSRTPTPARAIGARGRVGPVLSSPRPYTQGQGTLRYGSSTGSLPCSMNDFKPLRQRAHLTGVNQLA